MQTEFRYDGAVIQVSMNYRIIDLFCWIIHMTISFIHCTNNSMVRKKLFLLGYNIQHVRQ